MNWRCVLFGHKVKRIWGTGLLICLRCDANWNILLSTRLR